MGRAPCCEKVGLKRGRWTTEEDEILKKYIQANGEGSWRSLPKNAGLLRCGKSCRLRWINYLRSDLKRGNISAEEEDLIIKLHGALGNRWSLIAGHLPGRTDNEIKNYWNSHLSRRVDSLKKPADDVHPLTSAIMADLAQSASQVKRKFGQSRSALAKKKRKKRASESTFPTVLDPSIENDNQNAAASAVPIMPSTPTTEESVYSSTSSSWQPDENNVEDGTEPLPIESGDTNSSLSAGAELTESYLDGHGGECTESPAETTLEESFGFDEIMADWETEESINESDKKASNNDNGVVSETCGELESNESGALEGEGGTLSVEKKMASGTEDTPDESMQESSRGATEDWQICSSPPNSFMEETNFGWQWDWEGGFEEWDHQVQQPWLWNGADSVPEVVDMECKQRKNVEIDDETKNNIVAWLLS